MSLENMQLLNDLMFLPHCCNECYERFDVIYECSFCNEIYCAQCFIKHWIPCPKCNVKRSCTLQDCTTCTSK
jgi:hypothetical protein